MTAALRCACALALLCLLSLLLPPEGALGVELQPQEPRIANWLLKFFSGGFKKSKTHKKPVNATKSPPLNTTKLLPSNTTKSLPSNTTKLPLPKTMKLPAPSVAPKAPVVNPAELHPPPSPRGSR